MTERKSSPNDRGSVEKARLDAGQSDSRFARLGDPQRPHMAVALVLGGAMRSAPRAKRDTQGYVNELTKIQSGTKRQSRARQ